MLHVTNLLEPTESTEPNEADPTSAVNLKCHLIHNDIPSDKYLLRAIIAPQSIHVYKAIWRVQLSEQNDAKKIKKNMTMSRLECEMNWNDKIATINFHVDDHKAEHHESIWINKSGVQLNASTNECTNSSAENIKKWEIKRVKRRTTFPARNPIFFLKKPNNKNQ